MRINANTSQPEPVAPACRYGSVRIVAGAFDEVLGRLEQRCHQAGLAVLYRLRLDQALQAETGGGRYPLYMLLGVCFPLSTVQALAAEPHCGLVFPCQLAVYEDHQGRIVVMSEDPARIMDLLHEPAAIMAAMEIKESLEALLEGL